MLALKKRKENSQSMFALLPYLCLYHESIYYISAFSFLLLYVSYRRVEVVVAEHGPFSCLSENRYISTQQLIRQPKLAHSTENKALPLLLLAARRSASSLTNGKMHLVSLLVRIQRRPVLLEVRPNTFRILWMCILSSDFSQLRKLPDAHALQNTTFEQTYKGPPTEYS